MERIGSDRRTWKPLPRREEGEPFKTRDPDAGKPWSAGECWIRGTEKDALTSWLPGWTYESYGGGFYIRAREYPIRIAALLKAEREQRYELGTIDPAAPHRRWSPCTGVPLQREPLDQYERENMVLDVLEYPPSERNEAAKRIAEGDKKLAQRLLADAAVTHPLDAEVNAADEADAA